MTSHLCNDSERAYKRRVDVKKKKKKRVNFQLRVSTQFRFIKSLPIYTYTLFIFLLIKDRHCTFRLWRKIFIITYISILAAILFILDWLELFSFQIVITFMLLTSMRQYLLKWYWLNWVLNLIFSWKDQFNPDQIF